MTTQKSVRRALGRRVELSLDGVADPLSTGVAILQFGFDLFVERFVHGDCDVYSVSHTSLSVLWPLNMMHWSTKHHSTGWHKWRHGINTKWRDVDMVDVA